MIPSQDLRKIYWLSGSPCAGKTTIAKLLAERFDWHVYHCDDWFAEHRQRSTSLEHPTFYHVSRLSGDALWLRPVTQQIKSEISFCTDEFQLVLQDLMAQIQEIEQPILFDGTAALPSLVKPFLPNPGHAFWLIPTEDFQRHHYAQRPWIHDVLAKTSDPKQAFSNWMARDTGFARWLETQVIAHNMPWLSVDGLLTIEETAQYIAQHFRVADSPG